ncbi:16S rRNA m(7)G-527 methyltransferase [Tistlia consotensis]|uniref:Ribosomal RNA small subunit methyltransferase G n=1 Tax=Tistlia consotensis USBA 355 TaxID=560819 RepID=A0A1Y6BHB7_9PROT|nr:16S rRNA (guanine(527)-N(7))-methyltransferase RsmG [Tistlia consotensis]SMF09090.1 16S rRNA m(7)G-527 methyltransferase [Tistlia consotensis USBA 355]SNR34857.1 16S rRNA m(7)G-527 methyltransferase [Tistlia consotensis]
MTSAELAERIPVSRETRERLEIYAASLQRWAPAINLVARSSLVDLWRRHFLDSLQLLPLIRAAFPRTGGVPRIVDLGSGAGFPGLVLAIAGAGEVHLVEADRKKATFLREVARQTGAAVTLHNERIETLPPLAADVVTARALASAEQLLAWAGPQLSTHAICLFHKGRGAQAELTRLPLAVQDRSELLPSLSDPEARILRIRGPWT